MDSDPDAQSIGSFNGCNTTPSEGIPSVNGSSSDPQGLDQDFQSLESYSPQEDLTGPSEDKTSSPRHSVHNGSGPPSEDPLSSLGRYLPQEHPTGPADGNEASSLVRSPTKFSSRHLVRSDTGSVLDHASLAVEGTLEHDFVDPVTQLKALSDRRSSKRSSATDASGYIPHGKRLPTPPARRRRRGIASNKSSRNPSSPHASEHSSTPPIMDQLFYEYYDRESFSSSIPSWLHTAERAKTRYYGGRSKSPANIPRIYTTTDASFTSLTPSRPFSSLNPYAASISYSLGRGSAPTPFPYHSQDQLKEPDSFAYVRAFLLDTMPRQVYVHFMLRLPALYFLRVARIFDEADLSLHGIVPLVDNRDYISVLGAKEPSDTNSPYWNLKVAWQAFIDTLLNEWKTLNIISVLLLSAILTMLQLPGAVAESLILYSALASLICSLTSLLYGCMYIIRFSSMRKTYRAIAWAKAVHKAKTSIWWNVWVLLAMPAVWLAWSILLFMLCIMTYVWYVDPSQPMKSLATSPPVVPRAILSTLLVLALVYSALIAITFNQYGEKVDKERTKSVRAPSLLNPSDRHDPPVQLFPHPPHESPLRSVQPENERVTHQGFSSVVTPPLTDDPIYHAPPSHSSLDTSTASIASETLHVVPIQRKDIPTAPRSVSKHKVVGLWFHNHDIFPMPAISEQRGLPKDEWELFVSEICLAWDGEDDALRDKYKLRTSSTRGRPQDNVAEILFSWNERLTSWHSLQAVLCKEYADQEPNFLRGSDSPSWAVYLLDFSTDNNGNVPRLAERFGAVPQGFEKIVILDPRTAHIPFRVTTTTTIARRELGTHVRFRRESLQDGSGELELIS